MKPLNGTTVEKRERSVRILQFGEGNFLRAFVDWMVDIANERGVTDTSVAVVSPRFRENAGIRALREQDGMYHVCLEGVENGELKKCSRLVKCIADAFSPATDFERYERYILSPDLRFVVSNTTEAGIRYEADDVLADAPATFPGKITSMLYRRYRHFNGDPEKGLLFLCCELIEDNGSTLREYVLRHAAEAGLEPGFSEWVKTACGFCDTLVDRIVPGFPADNIAEVQAGLGFDDKLVVKGELYHVWAIGGEGAERVRRELPLHEAGLNVLFMPSVKEFRDKKVRILNGSHTGMVPVALQLGCETVLDAFGDADVSRFITGMVRREVLPMIEGDPEELRRFADGILERFLNPSVRHMLKSISLNSLSKWETRNYPTVADFYRRRGATADYELFTFAALLALYAPGSGFEPDDCAAHVEKIREVWNDADLPATVKTIVSGGIFNADFEHDVPGFSAKVAGFLTDIRRNGMRGALENFLNSRS